MLIEVNTEVLQKFGITADDFVYLYLLHAKSYDVVSTLCLTPNLEAYAKANSKAKRTYERYVGKDKTRHDYVIKCLKNELIHRKQSDSLGWMQMLQTWINNHTWEQYDSIENDKPTGAKTRITRKL